MLLVVKMHFKRLKNLREDHDFTQQYVATYLNISRVVYNRYESGVREMPISCLINLSRLYNVSVDYLIEEATETNNTSPDEIEDDN